MIRLSWFAFLLLSVGSALAQASGDSLQHEEKWSLMISAPNFGFIVPHNKQMTHLIQGHSYGFHTYFNKQLTTRSWHAAYNFPEHGIDLTYIYTGNPEQLGHQLALCYLLNLPLNRKGIDKKKENNKHRLRHWIGLGLGTGYTSKIWDLRENHQASVIGSHFNIALTLQYSARIVQFEKSEIRLGLRITHFSNGAFQIPNLGTNNAGVFLTYAFKEKRNDLKLAQPIKPEYKKDHRYSIFVGAGVKEIQPPTSNKYGAYTISLLAEKRLSYKSSLGVGGDFFYNTSIKAIQERKTNSTIDASDVMQAGLALSYTLHFRDFELKMQQGYYLRDKFKVDGSFYNRFGLRYRIDEHWFAQLTLKTHFAKADYGEWGFGYAF